MQWSLVLVGPGKCAVRSLTFGRVPRNQGIQGALMLLLPPCLPVVWGAPGVPKLPPIVAVKDCRGMQGFDKVFVVMCCGRCAESGKSATVRDNTLAEKPLIDRWICSDASLIMLLVDSSATPNKASASSARGRIVIECAHASHLSSHAKGAHMRWAPYCKIW